jgi:hypothetical protein
MRCEIPAAGVLLLFVLSGCTTYQRYERPDLLHPPTEYRRYLFGQEQAIQKPKPQDNSTPAAAAAAQVSADRPEISGPSFGLLSKTGSYFISVNDVCASGTAPIIDVIPSDAVKSKTVPNGRITRVEIDSTKLGNAKGVVVSVRSCRALGMSDEKARDGGLLRTVSFPITAEQFLEISSQLVVWSQQDTANEFGIEFANTFYAADAVFVNRNAKPLLVYGSSLTARIRFLPAKDDVAKVYSAQVLSQPDLLFKQTAAGPPLSDQINFKEDYRPMSFSDVLAIFTYQQRSDPRQRFVELLKSAGEVLTGAAIFTSARNYVKGVAFFTGIVNPEIEKQLLWDLLLHVKNLEARSLKEVEEVPPHGQLRKVVFFPRRPIYGVLPQIPVYIAEIRPDPASVSSTVIDKQATITTGGH